MSVNRLNNEPTFARLINDVVAEVGELAAAHADQLREEFRAKAAQARAILLLQMVGVIATSIGVVFFMVACVRGLIDAAGWTPALAWLAAGAVIATVGILMLALGHRRETAFQPVPQETIQSIRESLSCLSHR